MNINILIAWPAGSGIANITKSLAQSFTREWLFAFTNGEYQNRIRWGHNLSYVRIADKKLTSHSAKVDILVAMDKLAITERVNDINEWGCIVFDESIDYSDINSNWVEMIPVPAVKLAEEAGLKLTANVVLVWAVYAIMNRKIDVFKTVLDTTFKLKGDKIIDINHKALELGFNFVKENIEFKREFNVKGDWVQRFLMHGNEAAAMWAIKGGIKFFSSYPMTPSTTVLTSLAKEALNYDIVTMHVEDEISAINMAIGAGTAWVRAGTSTSGWGFALMWEALSFAWMTETPVIVYLVQRPGPSTWLATKTAQGDLFIAIYSWHGDFPRLVVAPWDHEDSVELSVSALNLSEKYQLPVIYLGDKYLSDSYRTCELNIADNLLVSRQNIASEEDIKNAASNANNRFPRYKFEENWVSKRTFPWMKGGEYIVNSYEHDEYGEAVDDTKVIKNMMDKRMEKMNSLENELPDPKVFGEADTVLFVWGSTKWQALEAQEILKWKMDLQVVQMQYLFPFKKEAVKKILKGKKIICVEWNQTGQLEQLLLKYSCIKADISIRKYDGEAMTGEWLAEQLLIINY